MGAIHTLALTIHTLKSQVLIPQRGKQALDPRDEPLILGWS